MTEQGAFLQARDSSACFGINTTTTMPEGAPCSEEKAAPFLLRAETFARGEKGTGKAKSKTALALLLCMAALLLTMGALAQEAGQVYRVASSEEWNNAIEQIEEQSETDATGILTADIGIFNNQYRYTIGVAGKHITVKSEGEGAPYSIGGKSMATVELSGDMTFDNVWLSLGQTAGRGGRGTISGFYANGYTAEFTENFEQIITNLYGGSNGKTTAVANTHLIINGDIICDANSQNYRVFGGGKNTSSGTTNGKVTGDVLIELGPHCRVPWVYGGGFNSSVGGDVTIILKGDINDPDHQVGNITGGGLGSAISPTGGSAVIASTGKDSGTVTGDIDLYLYSGRFASISGGGGQNGTDMRSSEIQAKNTSNAYYGKTLYYASVGGNVNVVIGTEGAADQTAVHTSQYTSTFGSSCSVIQGEVNVTINDGAYFPGDLTGMGRNDVVEGGVNITVNGGYIEDTLHGLGEMNYESTTPSPTQTIGKSSDPKEGSYYPKTAINITVKGGEIGAVAWSGIPLMAYGTKYYDQPTLYGNVMISIEGGSVGQVYMGNPAKADPHGFQNLQKLPKVYGTKGIELHVTGGSFTGNPSVYAHELTTCYNGQRIYFENDVPVFLYQINSANTAKNGDLADIIVNNTAPASI